MWSVCFCGFCASTLLQIYHFIIFHNFVSSFLKTKQTDVIFRFSDRQLLTKVPSPRFFGPVLPYGCRHHVWNSVVYKLCQLESTGYPIWFEIFFPGSQNWSFKTTKAIYTRHYYCIFMPKNHHLTTKMENWKDMQPTKLIIWNNSDLMWVLCQNKKIILLSHWPKKMSRVFLTFYDE